MQPMSIPGTSRQAVTSQDGTKLQRQYLYLPASVWHALQTQARASNTSVSQTIEHLANSGIPNLKEQNGPETFPRN